MNLHVDPRMYLGQSSSIEMKGATKDNQQLKQTCQEFEAVMVQMMFKAMRGAEVEGLFEKDMASDVYRDLFDGEVARDLAHNQSMGIGLRLYQQIQGEQLR